MRDARLPLLLLAICVLVVSCGAPAVRRVDRAFDRELVTRAEPARRGAVAGADGTIVIDGEPRSYGLYVPPGVRADAPLVVAFHGGGGRADSFAERTDLAGMARDYGFVLATPQGIRNSWNTGGSSPVGFSARRGTNDTAFVRALVDEISARQDIDRGRVFAVGLSAGGMMAYRAACELPGTFAAIAVVAGTMAIPDCAASGVALLHIHGTDDENVPLDGGAGELSARRADYPPVSRGIETFRQRNACGREAVTRPASDTSCEVSSCAAGDEVQLCLVQGGGHAWPGTAPAAWQTRNDVYVSPNFEATDYIGRFLQSQ